MIVSRALDSLFRHFDLRKILNFRQKRRTCCALTKLTSLESGLAFYRSFEPQSRAQNQKPLSVYSESSLKIEKAA
jgi:hypothetical protein